MYLLVASAKLLDDAYRTEKKADVRERLLLVRRVRVDNKEAANVAEKEFHSIGVVDHRKYQKKYFLK